MKVILQENVLKLGKAGDVVEAAPGYFRNFLQPRGLAVLATVGTLKKREEDLEALRKKQSDEIDAVLTKEQLDKVAAQRDAAAAAKKKKKDDAKKTDAAAKTETK